MQPSLQHKHKAHVMLICTQIWTVQTSGTQLMHMILPASSSTEKNIQAMWGACILNCFIAASSAYSAHKTNEQTPMLNSEYMAQLTS